MPLAPRALRRSLPFGLAGAWGSPGPPARAPFARRAGFLLFSLAVLGLFTGPRVECAPAPWLLAPSSVYAGCASCAPRPLALLRPARAVGTSCPSCPRRAPVYSVLPPSFNPFRGDWVGGLFPSTARRPRFAWILPWSLWVAPLGLSFLFFSRQVVVGLLEAP